MDAAYKAIEQADPHWASDWNAKKRELKVRLLRRAARPFAIAIFAAFIAGVVTSIVKRVGIDVEFSKDATPQIGIAVAAISGTLATVLGAFVTFYSGEFSRQMEQIRRDIRHETDQLKAITEELGKYEAGPKPGAPEEIAAPVRALAQTTEEWVRYINRLIQMFSVIWPNGRADAGQALLAEAGTDEVGGDWFHLMSKPPWPETIKHREWTLGMWTRTSDHADKLVLLNLELDASYERREGMGPLVAMMATLMALMGFALVAVILTSFSTLSVALSAVLGIAISVFLVAVLTGTVFDLLLVVLALYAKPVITSHAETQAAKRKVDTTEQQYRQRDDELFKRHYKKIVEVMQGRPSKRPAVK